MKQEPKFIYCNQSDRFHILSYMATVIGLSDNNINSSYMCDFPQKYDKETTLYVFKEGDLVDFISLETNVVPTSSFRKYLIIDDNDRNIYLLYNSIVRVDKTKDDRNILIIDSELRISMSNLQDCIRMIDQRYLDNLFEYFVDEYPNCEYYNDSYNDLPNRKSIHNKFSSFKE